MYTSFFGFRAKPFNNKPELRFHYITPAYAENFNTIRRDIREHQEVLVLTGEPGIGKTLFLQRLVSASQNQDVHFVSCPYSTLTFIELIDYVCDELGLTIEHMSLPEKIQWLQASLIENLQQGKTIVLVIDDAHNISDETLSELLSFSSAQKNEEHFLQIFLIGLPELEEKLHATMSAPSAHKVAYYRLWPLESSEVPKFIAQQLRAAGYQGNTIFTPSAVERIAEYTKGSLRALSLLCDASLVIAYMQSSRQVTADIVDEAAQQHCLIPQSQPEENLTRNLSRINETTATPSPQSRSDVTEAIKKSDSNQKIFSSPELQPGQNFSKTTRTQTASLPSSGKSEGSSLRRNLPVAAGLAALLLYGVVTVMQYFADRGTGSVKPLGDFFTPPEAALVVTTPSDSVQPGTTNDNQSIESPPSQEVLDLLEKAQQQIVEQNMFAPVGDNAFDTYQEILALDPDNKAAKAGLAILNQYSVQPVANEEEKQEQYDLQVEYAKKILKEFDEQFAVAKQEKEAYLKDLSNYYIGQAIMANQKRLSYSIETVLLANLQDGTSPGAMGGVVSNESLEDLLNDKSPPTIGSLTNPNAPEIVDRHLIRARMLMKSGNLLPPGDNALAQFKAILKLAPGNAESLAGIETVIDHTLNEAAHALDVGQPAQAERLLSKAVKIDPDHAELAKKARRIRRDIELWKITLNPPAPDECSKNAGITKPELIESMLQNASQGKAAKVSELISAGVHTDVMDGHQDTALMLAAQNGHNEIIKILLDKGAKIDCTNSLGETALMYAVRNGHAETTSLLISRRASLHFKTKEEADGRTALFMAIENGDFAITRLLLQNGAQPDVKDNIGKTPLMIAAGLGYEPIVKLLLNQNINLDAQDGDGRTALMLAARNGRVDVLRTLLENGAEIHIEDSGGNNAIYHAMAGGHLQAAQLLQRAAEASAANLKQNNFAMEA